MIVSVLGGSGFVGLELVQELINQNNKVRVLSRKNYYPIKEVDLFVGDLTDPKLDLDKFLNNTKILYNCAGEINDEHLMKKLHIDGTKKVISFAKGKISRWVQLSSVGAYGSCGDQIINENSIEKPIGIYETTKTESDNLVKKSGIDYVILRPSNIFGLKMSNQSLFELIKIIRKKYFFYVGSKEYKMNYIHVSDVVKSLILCSKNDKAIKNIYILSQTISIKKMIEAIQVGLGIKYKPLVLPKNLIKYLIKIIGVFKKSFPLTESRTSVLTSNCKFDNRKILSDLRFEFNASLEKQFIEFASYHKNGK